MKRRSSFVWRASLAACAAALVAIGADWLLAAWLDAWLAAAIAAAVAIPLAIAGVRRPLAPMTSMFRALAGTATSYRDGDFAFSLAWDRNDELGDLVDAHNQLGDTLRKQREALVQRELLLDTMVQHTPVAMMLADRGGHVVYGNLAARRLLGAGKRLEGLTLTAILAAAPEAMREAFARGGDGLFVVDSPTSGDEDIFYLARSTFRLNGNSHELFALRHLTAELHRQEVRTWKKVIRVISHELNNSLAPIASLAHSGAELVRRNKLESSGSAGPRSDAERRGGSIDQLETVFATIAERARHLEQFLVGYAKFAKLPAPQPEAVAWSELVERLRSQVAFELDGALPDQPARVDRAQLVQALLNLLANAHESGSAPDGVALRVRHVPTGVAIEVLDRGPGMTETVLSNALLPFYSTKRGGTGLGLALVREIAEAHGGRVALANRDGGGLSVTITLPQ